MTLPECTFVIFGATGDLAKRKLLPALYKMCEREELHPKTKIIAIGRKPYSNEQIRRDLKEFVKGTHWDHFSKRITYHQLEFHDDAAYERLKAHLKTRLKIFYFATPPAAFPVIIEQLSKHGIAHKEADQATERLVFEKPFGSDLKSAQSLNAEIGRLFNERQIYRIDHYLGKELVQNILVLRFTNPIFDSLWDSKHIDNVQITSIETDGVLERGEYYDHAGVLRDMVQNHLLQMLSLTAMEAPVSLDADDIRSEKVKILRSIHADPKRMVLGQYTAGKGIPDYTKEKNIAPKSTTETFAALRITIENKRWHGVPFYIKTGKALSGKYAEVVVTFKEAPCLLFCGRDGKLAPNQLIIRVQPDEGVRLQFNLREEGDLNAKPYTMDFLHEAVGLNTREAYERLLADVMRGDQTLFTRWDEVEQAWRIVDNLRKAKVKPHHYKAGSDGPDEANALLKKDGRTWVGNRALGASRKI